MPALNASWHDQSHLSADSELFPPLPWLVAPTLGRAPLLLGLSRGASAAPEMGWEADGVAVGAGWEKYGGDKG